MFQGQVNVEQTETQDAPDIHVNTNETLRRSNRIRREVFWVKDYVTVYRNKKLTAFKTLIRRGKIFGFYRKFMFLLVSHDLGYLPAFFCLFITTFPPCHVHLVPGVLDWPRHNANFYSSSKIVEFWFQLYKFCVLAFYLWLFHGFNKFLLNGLFLFQNGWVCNCYCAWCCSAVGYKNIMWIQTVFSFHSICIVSLLIIHFTIPWFNI